MSRSTLLQLFEQRQCRLEGPSVFAGQRLQHGRAILERLDHARVVRLGIGERGQFVHPFARKLEGTSKECPSAVVGLAVRHLIDRSRELGEHRRIIVRVQCVHDRDECDLTITQLG